MQESVFTNRQKVKLFTELFSGFQDAYGTYDPKSGKYWQVKKQLTVKTIFEHLKGIQPFGFYLLTGDMTKVGVADFDDQDSGLPVQFIKQASEYGIHSYLERSKSKGYHAWMFFPGDGVTAWKVRLVIGHILKLIDSPETEIFPKQDSIDNNESYGNFINAPLFGSIVPYGKTVFVNPEKHLLPYDDQWLFLQSVIKIPEELLDKIIDDHNLQRKQLPQKRTSQSPKAYSVNGYGLPVCIRKILDQGVTFNQRIACFRLAVHLKRVGMPEDSIVDILLNWRMKNRPENKKRIITSEEIAEQVCWAYRGNYTGYGCQEEIIQYFCDMNCPLNKSSQNQMI